MHPEDYGRLSVPPGYPPSPGASFSCLESLRKPPHWHPAPTLVPNGLFLSCWQEPAEYKPDCVPPFSRLLKQPISLKVEAGILTTAFDRAITAHVTISSWICCSPTDPSVVLPPHLAHSCPRTFASALTCLECLSQSSHVHPSPSSCLLGQMSLTTQLKIANPITPPAVFSSFLAYIFLHSIYHIRY